VVEIEYDGVVRVFRIDLEVRGSREALVWSGISEALSLGDDLTLIDLQANQASVRRRVDTSENDRQREQCGGGAD
jgi:hypothetical protein